MTPLGREWVRKAEFDRGAAITLRARRPVVHNVVCFRCQQYAEKYLKARLHESGEPVRRTHDCKAIGLQAFTLALRMVVRMDNKHVSSSYRGCVFLAAFGFYELLNFFFGYGLSAYITGLVGGDTITNFFRFWLLSFVVFTVMGIWLFMRIWDKRKAG